MELHENRIYRSPDGDRFVAEKPTRWQGHDGWMLCRLPARQTLVASNGKPFAPCTLSVLPDGQVIRMVQLESDNGTGLTSMFQVDSADQAGLTGAANELLLPVGGSVLRFREEQMGWTINDLTEEINQPESRPQMAKN